MANILTPGQAEMWESYKALQAQMWESYKALQAQMAEIGAGFQDMSTERDMEQMWRQDLQVQLKEAQANVRALAEVLGQLTVDCLTCEKRIATVLDRPGVAALNWAPEPAGGG